MKRVANVLVAAAFIALLSSCALGVPIFNIIRVPNSSPNVPTAINNAGEVVVNRATTNGYFVALWNRVTGTQSLNSSGETDLGVAINDGNDVAGSGGPTGSGKVQAFLWEQATGTMFLGTLGGVLSEAYGINANRDIVGMAYTAENLQHAFLWTESGGMQDLTPDLTSPGGATATAINSSGEVIGYYYPNGASNIVGFIWTEANGMQTFGNPGTMPLAVSDDGTIVGQELTSSGFRHAFSRTPEGDMVDLGTLGGDESTALTINNKGWIAGTSLTSAGDGVVHGFLWTSSAGMQDLTSLSTLGTGQQPYSMSVNDYGDIAVTTRQEGKVLAPNIMLSATSSPNPSVVGQEVTLTATLSSIAGPPPDGETVQFVTSGLTATGTLKNGVAQATITPTKAASYKIAVIYGGDVYYLNWRYTPITQVVNK